MTTEQAWNVLRRHSTARPGDTAWVSAPTLLQHARSLPLPYGQRVDVERAAKTLALT